MASNFIFILFSRIYFESFNYFNSRTGEIVIMVSEPEHDLDEYEADDELIALEEVSVYLSPEMLTPRLSEPVRLVMVSHRTVGQPSQE